MSNLGTALTIAMRVHAGQVDKQGEPYLMHVLRVVNAVEGERAKVLAALHDVIEDGGYLDLEPLFEEDGMWIDNSIEVLTRSPNETYAEYIESIRAGHSSTWVAEIREVKLADLRDNLGRIPVEPRTPCLVCGGTAVLNPGSGGGCGYCQSTGLGRDWKLWQKEWLPLRRRYEKAIATLEAPL